MVETNQFEISLLSGTQSQKHVSVNEALALLDAVAQLRVESATQGTPPEIAPEGACYIVGPNPTGEWSGQAHQLAVCVNGGWRFVTPKQGWQAYNIEVGEHQLFDGNEWLGSTLIATSNGSATTFQIIEFDYDLSAGATFLTNPVIPAQSTVTGITGRVISEITGTLTSWRVGVSGSDDRYGSGLGVGNASYLVGLTGAPVTYYSDTPLLLSAEGGDFATGQIRFAIHLMSIKPPRVV
jgi:hypothetical protein